MKLYTVTMTITLVVEARDEDAAADVATGVNPQDLEAEWTEADIDVRELTSANVAPSGWLDALPWGGDGDSTVRQILGGKS